MTVTMEGLAMELHHAREDARRARDTAMQAHENTGRALRELAETRLVCTRGFDNTHARLDELLSWVRRLDADMRSIRPKVDSYSELEPALREETKSHNLAAHRRRTLRKWGVRALLGFFVGAATVSGGALAATVLEKCSHGKVVVPSGPESP